MALSTGYQIILFNFIDISPLKTEWTTYFDWQDSKDSKGKAIKQEAQQWGLTRVGYRKAMPIWHRFLYDWCQLDRNATPEPIEIDQTDDDKSSLNSD